MAAIQMLRLCTALSLAAAAVANSAPQAAAAPPEFGGSALRVAASCEWPGLDAALRRFSRLLQFETVSDPATPTHARDPRAFEALNAFLASDEGYGASVFSRLAVERVGASNLSHLITWPGTDPSLRPALFVSHTDVVPVAEASRADWTHPPFSGAIADGYVWGRGALDVKVRALRDSACVQCVVWQAKDGPN